MICVVMCLFVVIILEVKGDYLASNCEKISFDAYQDAVQDSEFVGHVFHNSVTLNPIQCYTWCIQDCRCLSLNYKEDNDQRYCELNEGNHFTNKSSLRQSPESRYYILRRDYGSEGDVVFYDYLDSSAVSSDSPNGQAYLIKRDFRVWLRDYSTHWRATCRYNTEGTVDTNYLRASFEDFDIVRVTPTLAGGCQKYEFVNIRGNEFANCTAGTWYLKGTFRLYLDSSQSYGCDFDGSQSGDAVASADNFGLYDDVNSKFRCTLSSEATTQFWFGSK